MGVFGFCLNSLIIQGLYQFQLCSDESMIITFGNVIDITGNVRNVCGHIFVEDYETEIFREIKIFRQISIQTSAIKPKVKCENC